MTGKSGAIKGVPTLIRYEAACRAVAEAKTVDEAKDLRDKAEAMRAYARQAKNRQLEVDTAEIRMRAERRLGEIIKAQKDTVGLAKGGQPYQNPTGRDKLPVEASPTLAEIGIDKDLSSRAQKLAAVPEDKFEGMLGGWRERVADETERVTTNLLKLGENYRANSTGENEWYTPANHIEIARQVLGEIDLDPASNAEANKIVKAKKYFSEEDDGLSKEWSGRVWLNPPYSRDLMGPFVNKLIESYKSGSVPAAIMVSHNNTDTAWFHSLSEVASAVCFPRQRIKFYRNQIVAAPVNGQAFFYLGRSADNFIEVYKDYGVVMVPA
tara:strand:- start:266 stop:1237 length:972 start_codon:yes stop_codon:yes gene_type:complete